MRKLPALTVALAATLALMPSSATAQVELESISEGTMCDDITAGYCEVWLEADLATLVVHTIFGEFSYACDVDMAFHVQSDGSMTTESVSLTDETGGTHNCDDVTPCEQPWTAQLSEASGGEFMDMQVCITNALVTCEGTRHSPAMTDTGSGYAFEIVDEEIEGEPNCEYTIDYSMDGIEIHH